MNFNFLKKNIIFISLLGGFATGSLSSSAYYYQQRSNERKAFLECQQAWEKYYQLDQPTNPQYSEAISQKLNTWGFKVNPNLIATALHLAKQQWPWLNYSNQKENSIFNLEQQKYLVYHHEILPKCQKLKDWEKLVNHLAKK